MSKPSKAGVLGIDAIMIYSNDAARLSAWYATHLGIENSLAGDGNYYGDVVEQDRKTVHFGIYPTQEELGRRGRAVMVNFRVEDFEGFLKGLTAAGIEVEDRCEESYGKFAHIRDCDGNPVEIWSGEPV